MKKCYLLQGGERKTDVNLLPCFLLHFQLLALWFWDGNLQELQNFRDFRRGQQFVSFQNFETNLYVYLLRFLVRNYLLQTQSETPMYYSNKT